MPDTKPLSKHEVLVKAMECAQSVPPDERLTGAAFGRYAAENAGWYWELTYTRTFGMTRMAEMAEESFGRRCQLIIAQWAADTERVERPEEDEVTSHA